MPRNFDITKPNSLTSSKANMNSAVNSKHISNSAAAVLKDEWAPPDDEIGITLSQALRGSRRARAKQGYNAGQLGYSQGENRVGKRRKRPMNEPEFVATSTATATTGTVSPQPFKYDKETALLEVFPCSPKSSPVEGFKCEPPVSDSRSDADHPATTTNQQYSSIVAMFSDSGSDSGEVDDFYAAGEEKRDERDSSIEEVAEAVSQPKRSYNTQRLFPPRMDFMDEESARNYRQILAKNRKNTGRTIKDPKELIKGHDRSTNHQHLSEIDEAVSSDELPDSALSVVEPTNNIINTGARRTSRPRTLQISDSEATDDPDALDERAILNHRLRSSKTSSRPSLSRFEQARLRLRQPPKVLDTDNSDYEIDDVSEKEAQTHSQFVDDIENTSSDDSSKMDILETESDTNHHTRNSVLVIRDSSDEGDEDFISETEETYLASKPTSSDTKMGKFLTVFEPRRRRYMQQKLTMRRRTTDTTDTNLPSKSKVKSPKSKVKLAKGYSQELDDDLADFIVDDDEIEKDEQSNAIGESENEEARSIWRSAHKDYGSDIELSDGSEKSAAPKLGLGGRDDLKDLMPEEFSQFDLPTSFKAYVQYLVYWLRNGHKKPAMSNKNARYFFFAYITVSRVIDSVEQSLVDSSAWVDKFRRDLHSYPEIQISRITAIQGCDACHFRKNRTATFCICLLGKPYNRDILIPPRPGESVIATSARIQSDSESINSDSDFESLSPRREQRNVKYNVGRTCKQRSKVGHELHHYFYHLSTLVEIALSTLAFSDIENVDTTTATWEEADPDDLVDLMDSQGIIDKLYAGFKDLVSRSKSGFAS